MKWKRKLLPKTNNAKSSKNPIFIPFHLCDSDESLQTSIPNDSSHKNLISLPSHLFDHDESLHTFIPNDSSHIRPTIEPCVVTPHVVQPNIRHRLQLLNSSFDSPVEGIQDSASGCLKRKSPASSSRNVFSRYSELCGRNVLVKCSMDITLAVEHPDMNVFEKYSDLCRRNAVTGTSTPFVHVVRDTTIVISQDSSGEPLRLNVTEGDALLDDKTHLNTPIGGVFRLNDGACSSGQSEGGVRALFFWVFTDSFLFGGIIDNVSKKGQWNTPVLESYSKKAHHTAPRATNRRIVDVTRDDGEGCSSGQGRFLKSRRSYGYADFGDCNQQCQHCGAAFWFGERLKGHSNYRRPEYHLCCEGGRIYMQPSQDPPEYFKNLLQNKHFMENIRAYNQMFAMTSFGAKINESINQGRGPYVFKVSGKIYHWIGSLCPPPGESPRFLQLYIYDTNHEVENRMRHFGSIDDSDLDPEIVEGARGYELLVSNALGAVVFDRGVSGSTDFDIITQEKLGPPKRISKLHKSYMSLQFPLLFIYGQPGFYPELKLRATDGSRQEQKVTMLAYYRGERDGYEVGGRIILLMSFTGGPRYMYAHYLDALAICRKLGNPHFSITFTCNVNCPEIKDKKSFRSNDRSSVYGGVLKKGFTTLSYLLWVPSESKIKEAQDVDRFISSELPDPKIDPQGYRVVFDLMMYGPCGAAKMSASCIKGDKCSKNFPKKYTSHTFFDEKGQGTDKIFARVSKPLGESSNVPGPSRPPIDEIQNYLEGRFVCEHEACCRILKFDIHRREPVVQILVVHLQGMQRITFRDRDNLESVINLPVRTSTTLTEWFAYNEANQDGRHLTYQDFPSEFVWYDDRKN
nr:helitron helicase-like domain-containing protein [Tanacetum cinerariifolium]